MVVKNTGLSFINGTFDNLTNGQPVALSYGGCLYHFVANYSGGSGNDLVLVWGKNRIFAWGYNWAGQLGNDSLTERHVPTPVATTGVLAGKMIVDIASGRNHSVALCSDGTVAAWGRNEDGAVGDNTTTNRRVPVAVDTGTNTALFGKTVVAIAAGNKHTLALCSDGTMAAWACSGLRPTTPTASP